MQELILSLIMWALGIEFKQTHLVASALIILLTLTASHF